MPCNRMLLPRAADVRRLVNEKMTEDKLHKQIQFLIEIDKLKNVFRKSYLLNSDRKENDAEHSWHLGMMAILLAEHANEKVNLLHVLKMVLIHDIVEIDAGDTFCYDVKGNADKARKEKEAAKRIYNLLPEDQGQSLKQIWEEYEEGNSPESKFARALDRLMPMLHNFYTKGRSWKENGITSSQVLQRNSSIAEGSEKLWDYARKIIQDSIDKDYLKE